MKQIHIMACGALFVEDKRINGRDFFSLCHFLHNEMLSLLQ